ncbi:hypothetical protein JTB14_031844 [Gonioctena quinquepunctata]|nr:hypothetical protein JTB14_031844 [Gonioctena quinquepunctata]
MRISCTSRFEQPLTPQAVQTVFTKLVSNGDGARRDLQHRRVAQMLHCSELFPGNYIILSNLGAYMFKIAEVDIARRYLERAVKVNKDYLPAEINLMHVKWHQIPRWHFRMLNDKRRNLAYDRAIAVQINKGFKNVIDVGAGCGLLSLSAAKHQGTSVTAIEENKQLVNMCKDVLKANEVSNVNVLHCYSTDIAEPPDKCNLLVTEVFDVALFGERALETILHALTVLCTEDDFKIIPCQARVFVTGINSDELLKKHQCVSSKSLDLLNLQNTLITENDLEPYEAEYLSERNVAYMTDTRQIIDVNFYDPHQIYEILNDSSFQNIIQLKCEKEGVVHAVAVWFDLDLTKDISITTNPLSEECVSCWEQAVIYLDHPVQVKEGDVLSLCVTVKNCKLCVSLVENEEDTQVRFRVSEEVVTFLNDDGLVDSMTSLAQKFWGSNLMVVDYNVFPLLGFLLAKNNNCTVYHTIKTESDKPFFEYILSQNNIPRERFVILDEFEIDASEQRCLFFFDMISTDGSLENCGYKKLGESITSVKLPQSVKINVQLMHSPYIDRCNRVADENVLDFRIGEFINEYSGYEHPNLENFRHTEHSLPVTFPLEGDGEKTSEVVVNKSGLVNSLYVWYDLQFYEDVVYSTKDSTHYKKTCFFFSSPKRVEEGERFCIKMHLDGSYLKFSL